MNKAEALREISALTQCGDCTDPSLNCCHDIHCAVVAKAFPSMKFEEGSMPKARFLTSHGCSVPPEYRELCSVHTCDRKRFKDPEFRRPFYKLMSVIEGKDGCQ